MLLELRVENLLLIERAELRFGPGLTAVTGETGAGKTVLAHALDLLLGGRPRTGIVRPGASEAYVEGIFALPPGLLEDAELDELRERLPDHPEELVLGRRVAAEGRTRAFVEGRSASAGDLALLAGRLISFYGQHEHRRLTVASQQLEILDAFAGDEHLAVRRRHADTFMRARARERELEALRTRTGARERERDLLEFELREIEELAPDVQEETRLREERERLRRLDALRSAALGGAEALATESPDGADARAALAASERGLESVAGVDAQLDALGERLRALRLELEDLGGELRRYVEGLTAEPGRLEAVEERLERYDRLTRKHGGSVEAVLAHGERCRGELTELETAAESAEQVECRLSEAVAEEEALARRLTTARARAAPLLAEAVRAELAELEMDRAAFSVELERRERRTALGNERAEMTLAPNPGVPAAPLREAASGGELSRAMLALMTVASGGPQSEQTLVFDEVDAGIGGKTARAIGRKLRALATQRQVICITHLPQIASLADRHFRIEKRDDGELAEAVVEELEDGAVVEELCRMLGSGTEDEGARRHAEELLAAA